MRVRRVVRGGFLRPNAYGHTTHKSTRLHMNGWRWYHVCIRLVLLLNANASNYFIFRFVVSLTLSTIFILISFLYFEIFVFVVDLLVVQYFYLTEPIIYLYFWPIFKLAFVKYFFHFHCAPVLRYTLVHCFFFLLFGFFFHIKTDNNKGKNMFCYAVVLRCMRAFEYSWLLCSLFVELNEQFYTL